MSQNNRPNRAPSNRVKEHQEPYQESNERFEIIHGIRYDFQPSPSFVHQVIVTRMSHILDQTCHTSGIVVVAPMDVHLDEQNTVQPDLVFIREENLQMVKHQRIEGVPDLLVEILSKGSGKHDRSRKMALYEEFRVPEYWIVDPVHFTVEQFVLVKDRYTLRTIYGEGDTMDSDTFPCVNIDIGALFETAKRFVD